MQRFLTVLLLLAIFTSVDAQVLPHEGSRLNYRIVGFSFPKESHLGKYKIQIAAGNYSKEDSFKKNIVRVIETSDSKTIAEIPAFGRTYTWQVSWTNKKNMVQKSPLHHFSTYIVPNADTTKFRLKILQPTEQYKDYFASVDEGGVLYDMNGAPVWFLPDTNGIGSYVADMEFTPEGTVTFLYKKPYETNFNGDILWKVKKDGVVSGDTMGEFFHHEFRRLSNGHYMALGSQITLCKVDTVGDSVYIEMAKGYSKIEKDGYRYGIFGTLIEYDQEGNVVWSWKSSKYFIGSDYDYYVPVNYNIRFEPHDNAFFFDEKNKCIYMGFRNISRIYKIEYPGGRLLATYGDCYKPGCHAEGSGLFCGQHNIGRTQDGYLYVFNNNSCKQTDSLPTIMLLQESVAPGEDLKKVWEFVCPAEPNVPRRFFSGGNVKELSDRSFFINMGAEYSKLLIVNRDKKILWSGLPERFIETDRIWVPIHQYRANIISRQELEKLIWKAEDYKP